MRQLIKDIIKRTPVLGEFVTQIYWTKLARNRPPEPFPGSVTYWEQRYLEGGDSGVGSYGSFAKFKADVLNKFVAEHNVQSVIEFGCGDGAQLGLANYPSYKGFDVSGTVISKCKERYESDPTKSFGLLNEYRQDKTDLTLSLDVVYHLVEDSIFENHMTLLFGASQRYVIIYSSDSDDNRGYEGTYVRHRKFTRWIQDNMRGWKLREHLPNEYRYRGDYRTGSFADFFIYEKA